jgi:flavin reductase (DIM6/NTAB) family NADH-FMN oxidoreductase RutF
MASMQFSQSEFRAALGRFPTGVAIATTISQGERLGLTISSFNSVSLHPPLVLFSIAKGALSFSAWQAAAHYAINVLSEEQQELSTRFAKAMTGKWDGVSTITGSTGAPVIPNALVAFECAAHARHDGGDHEIFVGQVLAIRVRDVVDIRPLVFHGGRYRRLDAGPSGQEPATDYLFLHGW